jgi:hypothetical protein
MSNTMDKRGVGVCRQIGSCIRCFVMEIMV